MITIQDILNNKKKEIKNLQKIKCARNKKILNLNECLREKPFICEIKRSSPSKGTLNNTFNAVELAKVYENAGAGAISVLTDKTFFSGDMEELYEISKKVNIPILCKDFIISKIQIENAHISGADAILLIVSILDNDTLKILTEYATSLKLNILFEIHDFSEFERIEHLKPKYVGVNSRNLSTMKIEKERAAKLIKLISSLKGDFLKIAESGIETCEDLKYFKNAGANAFLIGTALMTSKNPQEKIKEFYKCL
jgi:indole-3-glycerol phosphate synthase